MAKGYSGGMRRRLDLAGALVARPPVLFLDEPTTGLDPRSRTSMWQVIRGLVSEGTSLLLTTQYLEEADLLADNIVVVDHGRLIAEGTADQLKAQVGGERLQVTVTDAAQLSRAEELLTPLAVGPVVREEERRGLLVPVSGGAAQLIDALRLLDAEGIGVDDVGPAPTDPGRRLPDPHRPLDRPAGPRPHRGGLAMSVLTPFADGLVVAKRNLIKIKRVPDLLVFTTLSPIMFVLLFAYVFGGAIDQSGGGSGYREFLIAGIFAQTVVFGSTITGAGHRRGRPEGDHRPVPHAADVALGGALRPHALRRGQQRDRAGGDVADRAARRLAHP